MATVKYPQVWKPDGTWYASFYTKEDAEKWVAKRTKNEPGWEINYKRPERKPRV
jgi:hypothetical protein